MSSNDVAAFAMVLIFGMPIAYAMISRIYAHQERLEMIRRGIVPPPDARTMRQMARGKVWGGGAFGYGQAQPGQPLYDPYFYAQYQANRTLRKGVVLTMIGFALLVGLSFIDIGQPGPWLLGGLIPMFIGIAQVIVALLSGARLGPFGASEGVPPPSTSAEQPAAAQPAPGPYAWRPGSTTELQRPVRPPDFKP
ncbi:MAG: DUF6249 domain-containing protein [Vulcanimicrobiaceae bacterium]